MHDRIRLGSFELSPGSRQLREHGKPVPLGGRAFDLLLCLLNNHERVVSKSELMDAVWGSTVVVENNLNAQIAALRKVLGSNALVSVSGRGYRLALEVDTAAAPADGLAAPLPQGASIAVMPFDNLSDDSGQVYFADGVAEDIRNALSNFKQLRVISSQSSFSMRGRTQDVRQTWRELGAGYVLEGGVRRSAQRLRVTARLIETDHGAQLWGDHFDGMAEDVFEMQDRIAAQVAAAIEPAIRKVEIDLARRRRPGSLAAYDLYIQAVPLVLTFEPAANETALQMLNQALKLDPHYVPALAHAAWCYEQRLVRHWPNADESQRALAVDLAWRALAGAENDAKCIGLAGFVLFQVGRLYHDGLEAMRRAVALNPNDVNALNYAGTACMFMGTLDAAEAYLERGMRLNLANPDAFMFVTALGAVHLLRGDCPQALALANRSAALNPHWDFTWLIIAAAAGEMGDRGRAAQALDHLKRFAPDLNLPLNLPSAVTELFVDPAHRRIWDRAFRKAVISKS